MRCRATPLNARFDSESPDRGGRTFSGGSGCSSFLSLGSGAKHSRAGEGGDAKAGRRGLSRGVGSYRGAPGSPAYGGIPVRHGGRSWFLVL